MIDQARELAVAGYRVFPLHHIIAGECSCAEAACSSPGKHPRTTHGVKDATSDPKVIERWWSLSLFPEANIGIATGQGLYVIDLDGDAGEAAWAKLESEHGAAPSLSARTGGGGRHIYFSAIGLRLRNTASRVAPRIDTRGEGGYVLAPPSSHASGRPYAWRDLLPIARVPLWVAAMVEPKQHAPKGTPHFRYDEATTPYGRAILTSCLRRIQAAGEGTRNDTLTREAFILGQWIGGREIAPDGVLEMLLEACPDPDEKKTLTTARAQLREGACYPRSKAVR